MPLERITSITPTLSGTIAQLGSADNSGNPITGYDATTNVIAAAQRSQWLRGLVNGDFAAGPPDTTKPINSNADDTEYNPLLGWTLVDTSNGGVQLWWIANPTVAGGARIDAVIAASAPVGDCYIHQTVAVRTSESGQAANLVTYDWVAPAAYPANKVEWYVALSELDSSSSVLATTPYEFDLGTVSTVPFLQAFVPQANQLAATTQFDVQVGIRVLNPGATATTASLYAAQLYSAPPYLIIPDILGASPMWIRDRSGVAIMSYGGSAISGLVGQTGGVNVGAAYLREQAAADPPALSQNGIVFTKQSDHGLYFLNSAGTRVELLDTTAAAAAYKPLGAYPLVVDSAQPVAQVADITDTNFASSNVSGLYRVSVYLVDSTSAVAAGAVTCHIKFNDGLAAQDITVGPVVLTTLGAEAQATIFARRGSGSISYGVTHTGIFSTATYDLSVVCERLL